MQHTSPRKALLVSATTLEIAPTLQAVFPGRASDLGIGIPGTLFESERFDCIITGVGQMISAVHLAPLLASKRYSVAIQAGLAGSFTERFPKRAVVAVSEESLADLGAESPQGFLELFEMGLLRHDASPFVNGRLTSIPPRLRSLLKLPTARSVTVNRVLSDERSIAWVRERFNPEVVNMEGAAFLYACGVHQVAAHSVRAVSDMVGPRDKDQWDITGAVAALNDVLTEVCHELQTL